MGRVHKSSQLGLLRTFQERTSCTSTSHSYPRMNLEGTELFHDSDLRTCARVRTARSYCSACLHKSHGEQEYKQCSLHLKCSLPGCKLRMSSDLTRLQSYFCHKWRTRQLQRREKHAPADTRCMKPSHSCLRMNRAGTERAQDSDLRICTRVRTGAQRRSQSSHKIHEEQEHRPCCLCLKLSLPGHIRGKTFVARKTSRSQNHIVARTLGVVVLKGARQTG